MRYSTVTTVLAKGRETNYYNAAVSDIFTGIVFYRLKMTDIDGTFSNSPIIKIDKRKNTTGIAVLSNPVKDFIIINTTDKNLNNTQACIINMQGAVAKTFIIREGSQTVEVNDLSTGVYYLRTTNGSCRFLIQ